MKLTANIYTVSYFAFMKKNKDKYKLKTNEQIEIFYIAIFVFILQSTFIATHLTFEKFDLTYTNNAALNLCLFFTTLILHWMCLPDARNGIYMMKYAICYPKEFNNPLAVFFLGII